MRGTTVQSRVGAGRNVDGEVGIKTSASWLWAVWLAQLYYFSLKKLLDTGLVMANTDKRLEIREKKGILTDSKGIRCRLVVTLWNWKEEAADSFCMALKGSNTHEIAPLWALSWLKEFTKRFLNKQNAYVLCKQNYSSEKQDIVWILVYECGIGRPTWITPQDLTFWLSIWA